MDVPHFEWTVMPMGLSTAPASFQRWMEATLQGMETFTLVYLDEVLVYSTHEDQHKKDIRKVVERFKKEKMKVKLGKSEFAKNEIQFLGHVVADGQLRVDEDKLQKLALWESPLNTIKQVRQLLGFLSYHRAFVPHFATLTAPLTDLLKGKEKKVTWTTEAGEAMEAAKRASWDACSRYAWDYDRESRVTTDASGMGLGATFEQRVEGVRLGPSSVLVSKDVGSRNRILSYRPRVARSDRSSHQTVETVVFSFQSRDDLGREE